MRPLKKKWKMLGIVLAAVAVGAAAFGTYAYLTDDEVVQNEIGTGSVPTTIEEEFELPKKEVRVKNEGDVDVYVRVFMEVSKESEANRTGISPDGQEIYYSANKDGKPASVSPTFDIQDDAFIKHLPEGWVYIRSDDTTPVTYTDGSGGTVTSTKGEVLGGYYYYTKALKPGEYTEYLMKKVKTFYLSEKEVIPFDIIVYEESTTTKDHLGQPFTGSNAWEKAWGEMMVRDSDKYTSQ